MDSALRQPPMVTPMELPAVRRTRLFRWCLLSAVLPALALLYWFDPAEHSFYPRCQFNALTGLDCLGCGGLRATHALFHGDLAAAWRFNALLVLACPLVLLAFAGAAPAWLRAFWQRYWPTALLLACLAFTVLRNL